MWVWYWRLRGCRAAALGLELIGERDQVVQRGTGKVVPHALEQVCRETLSADRQRLRLAERRVEFVVLVDDPRGVADEGVADPNQTWLHLLAGLDQAV